MPPQHRNTYVAYMNKNNEYRFTPTNDIVFKRIFARTENLAITAGLISDFFDYQVTPDDIKLLSPESALPNAPEYN